MVAPSPEAGRFSWTLTVRKRSSVGRVAISARTSSELRTPWRTKSGNTGDTCRGVSWRNRFEVFPWQTQITG
jgi:hypothetical protein